LSRLTRRLRELDPPPYTARVLGPVIQVVESQLEES